MAFQVPEQYRMRQCGLYSSDSSYGNNGAFLLQHKKLRHPLFAIAGDGGGWEHVSVTVRGVNRCPNWDEMCFVKSLFWEPEDTVIQYHPSEGEYINRHAYCLHLWRPKDQALPVPPKEYVG